MSEEKTTKSPQTTTNLKLVSRLKYPVRLKLKDNNTIFIAAHGTVESIDSQLLDTADLPNGIHFIEFQA